MIICFREVLPQEKKSRLATKGIDSIILNESCWCSCFGWETSERCCKGEWCYSHDIRATRQEIRATSDTICRPVYATTQIFTDEEERTLSERLSFTRDKASLRLFLENNPAIQKNMSKHILTAYINVAKKGNNVETGHQPIWVTLF